MDFVESLNWDSPKNLTIDGEILLPTIVQDLRGQILGLAWSSKESLTKAILEQRGIYLSRTRGLWIKSPSRVNGQVLLEIKTDCDKDSLIFVVKQLGNFCHQETFSCFTDSLILVKQEKIVIGMVYGRAEAKIVDFLNQLGIFVWEDKKSRSNKLMVKSHLHPKIEIIKCKPKDIDRFLKEKIIDVAVCYSDNISNSFKSLFSKGSPSVKIVAVAKRNKVLRENLKILTEYPELTKKFYPDAHLILSNGNTEQFIGEEYADIGIVVCDTGSTLKVHDLEILKILDEPKIGIFFEEEIYKREPRFFRDIANELTEDVIYFYSVDGPYGFMSNFYPCQFVDEKGTQWESSEHYYQAHKFTNHPEIFESVRLQKTAKECYKMAYNHQDKFRADWFEVKDHYMWTALNYKFYQNLDLLEKLKETKPKKLVEHALKDAHYGCGIDGSGKNTLGVMLMQIRN